MEKKIDLYSCIYTDKRLKRDPENASEFTSLHYHLEKSLPPEKEPSSKSEVMNVSRKAHFLQGHAGQVEERLVNTVKP